MPGPAYALRMAVILAAAVVFLGTSFLPLAAITEACTWIGPGGFIHSSMHHHSGFGDFIDGVFALVFCSGCMGTLILLSLLPVIFTVLIAIWMYNDARSRGDSNAVVWAILGLLFNLVGLVIYLVVRESAPRPAAPVQQAPRSDNPPPNP